MVPGLALCVSGEAGRGLPHGGERDLRPHPRARGQHPEGGQGEAAQAIPPPPRTR